MKPIIHPSILNADFLHLGDVIRMLNESDCEMIHLDIMDGNYVPNLSFGLPIIEQIKKVAEKPLDVHLMISNAEMYIKRYADAGADNLTVHYEAVNHLHRTVMEIKDYGMKASVSLNPATPVSVLENILPELYMVLIMSVNPGFGAQKFIPDSYNKVRQLRQMITEQDAKTLIQIDGGVNAENIQSLNEAGVQIFVVGNTVFSSDDPKAMIRKLKGSNL